MVSAIKRRDSTFGTEERGDTPRSPHLAKATPRAENHRLMMNNT
jgi:hypothetical protein